MKLITLIFLPVIALLLSSCSNPMGRGHRAYSAYDRPASLPTDPSKVRVKVSTSKQMVYVMEGDRALLVTPVSVGTASTPTPKGHFRVQKKEHLHRANTHGYATNGKQATQTYLSKKPSGWKFKGTPMPYWVGFSGTDTYGFHTGWMKDQPCTHGCIRMHENVTPKFFKLVRVGTPVHIATSHPEDDTLGAKVKRPIDAGPLTDHPPTFYLGDAYFTKHKKPSFN